MSELIDWQIIFRNGGKKFNQINQGKKTSVTTITTTIFCLIDWFFEIFDSFFLNRNLISLDLWRKIKKTWKLEKNIWHYDVHNWRYQWFIARFFFHHWRTRIRNRGKYFIIIIDLDIHWWLVEFFFFLFFPSFSANQIKMSKSSLVQKKRWTNFRFVSLNDWHML